MKPTLTWHGMAPLTWLLTRVVAAALLWYGVSGTIGDAHYYGLSLRHESLFGLDDTLREYPTPAAMALWLIMQVFSWVGLSLATGLMFTVIAFDAAMFVMLRRRSAEFATWMWIVGAGVLGSTAYARFDLIPGVLVGLALLVATIHPRTAGAFVALATGVKLWPAVALLPTVQGTLRRRAVFASFAVTGAVTLVLATLAGGFDRLVSPLTYQSDRGLQIESVSATPLMLVRAAYPDHWSVGMSSFKAVEIAGPGSSMMLTVSSLLTALWVLASIVAYLNLRLWDHLDAMRDDRGLWTALAVISGFMAVSKVLSPQYLLWLLPVACAAAALSRSRALRVWLAVLVVCCGLTEVMYPYLYNGLDTTAPTVWTWPATLLLVTRNVLLAGLTLTAFRHALAGSTRMFRPTGARPAARRERALARDDAARAGGQPDPV